MGTSSFIAIDFETANKNSDPCQLGVVIVKDWTIVQKMCYLIQPENNHYDYFQTNIHGITAIDTKNAPAFPDVWDKVKKYFVGATIVAHNAGFDRNVLFKALDRHGLDTPECNFICTLAATGLGLPEACRHFDIPLPVHHDALCDAEAAANIFIKVSKKGLSLSVMTSPWSKKESRSNAYVDSDFYSFDKILDDIGISEDNEFKGKRFLITGVLESDRDELKSIIKRLGGKNSLSVNKSVDFVIIGENPGNSKMNALSDLASSGIFIKRLTEQEMLEMIDAALKRQGLDIDDTTLAYD